MTEKVHLVLCENYRNEVLTVIREQEGFGGVSASFFPPGCGHPPLTGDELAVCIPAEDASVEIVGNGCLAALAGKESLCARCHLHLVTPCLILFTEQEFINRFIADGAYILTPGWLSGWRERMADWGFAPECLRDFLRESTTLLLLLDTGVDSRCGERLAEFAEYVRLPYNIVPTGLDYFTRSLRIIVLNSRLESAKRRASEAAARLRQKSSDYAMALDLLGRFTQVYDEEKMISLILDNFNMLFAPEALVYVSYAGGTPLRAYPLNSPPRKPHSLTCQRIADLQGDLLWEESGSGLFRVALGGECFGVVIADRIAFPEYAEHYLDLAQNVLLPICGLSINNVRSYQRVMRAEKALNKVNRELKRQAGTDGLTLVANRRRHDDYLAKEWRRAFREKKPLSVIMIDIDHFKRYNDRYGHQAGDDCLKAVARVISGCISRPADFVARYGGEEFSVILPNTTAEGAELMAEKIRRAVESARIEHAFSHSAPHVTLSLGVSTMVPTDAAAANRLVSSADSALYRAKKLGRNRVASAGG